MRRPWMVPLVPVYAAGAALRWAGVKPQRLGWPVVSVGNLSVGGTGKTPFTVALARLLTREGFAVDVLSRGYGRRGTTVERVDPEGDAERFGDEPLLIAREAGVPVFVGARRWEAGSLAEGGIREATADSLAGMTNKKASASAKAHAGPSTTFGAKDAPNSAQDDNLFSSASTLNKSRVHLLDDGFQHRQLYRDADVVLVNSEDLSDALLPAGNLREGFGGLRRATVFAVPADDDAAVNRLSAMGLEQPVWRFRREMVVPEIAGPVVAFCGIARPEQFFAGLEAAGVSVAVRHAFRDHQAFGSDDIALLQGLVRNCGAKALVTTAKDRIRLGALFGALNEAAPVHTIGLRVVLEDEPGMMALLRDKLELAGEKPGL